MVYGSIRGWFHKIKWTPTMKSNRTLISMKII